MRSTQHGTRGESSENSGRIRYIWMRERPTGQDNTETRSSPPLRHNSTNNSFCVDAKYRIRTQAHGRRRNLNQSD